MSFAERRERLTSELAGFQLDSFLVSGLPNVTYLTGFTGSNALLLLAPGVATLYTDPRYTIQAGQESDCDVKIVHGPLNAAAVLEIEKRHWKKLGFEAKRMDHGSFLELSSHLKSSTRLIACNGVVERLRTIKSPEEIDAIRRSVNTNSAAFEHAIRKITPKMTESGLAAEIEYQMRKLGAEKPAFDTIVAAGPRSALPHAQPSANPLNGNQLLLVDMGAMQGGYASDMTRMLHLGQPGPKARKLYKAVLEAQLAAIDGVKAGTTTGTVDRKARKVLKAHGFEKLFVHSTGHGLGLEIHEPPRVGNKDQTRLESGMVITIEPGAYMEGFGGVRIEDTVLVTERGCEVLTPTPKDLKIV